jgi:hypothetical protein
VTVTAAVGNIRGSDPLVSTKANGERGIGRNSDNRDTDGDLGDASDGPRDSIDETSTEGDNEIGDIVTELGTTAIGINDENNKKGGNMHLTTAYPFLMSHPMYFLNLHRFIYDKNTNDAIHWVECLVNSRDAKEYFQIIDNKKLVEHIRRLNGLPTDGKSVTEIYQNFTYPFRRFSEFMKLKPCKGNKQTKTWRHKMLVKGNKALINVCMKE